MLVTRAYYRDPSKNVYQGQVIDFDKYGNKLWEEYLGSKEIVRAVSVSWSHDGTKPAVDGYFGKVYVFGMIGIVDSGTKTTTT